MKVLLSAYYCNPDGVSEYYVGFRFWQLLREKHDVHLLTDKVKEKNWIDFLGENSPELKKITFIDLENVYKYIPRLFNLPYYIYNMKAYFAAKALMKTEEFDLIHHVTASMFRFPVFLSHLGVPFVWGPIGGSVPEPENFGDLFSGDRLDRRFRFLDKYIANYEPLVRMTMNRAAKILIATPHFYELFPKSVHKQMQLFKLCGFDVPEGRKTPVSQTQEDTFKMLFVGRLVPYKGLQFLLHAISRLEAKSRFRLDILGTGPYEGECKKLTSSLGMDDIVKFRGRVSHSEVLNYMSETDAYVIPSLRESWGISPLEAMSFGKPIIGVANGGLEVVLDSQCAIKIKPENQEQLIAELAQAIARLKGSESLRQEMGQAAIKRVREQFSWQKIGEELEEVYSEVVKEPKVCPAKLVRSCS